MRTDGERDLCGGPLQGGGGRAGVLPEPQGERRPGPGGDLQSGAHKGVQERDCQVRPCCDNFYDDSNHFSVPNLIPEEKCRQVPKEVCQGGQSRNSKFSLTFFPTKEWVSGLLLEVLL